MPSGHDTPPKPPPTAVPPLSGAGASPPPPPPAVNATGMMRQPSASMAGPNALPACIPSLALASSDSTDISRTSGARYPDQVILPRTARLSRAALVTVGLLLAVFGAASVAGDHGEHARSGATAVLQA